LKYDNVRLQGLALSCQNIIRKKQDPPRRGILGTKTETEAIDAASKLVVSKKQILKSLEKVARKSGGGEGILVSICSFCI